MTDDAASASTSTNDAVPEQFSLLDPEVQSDPYEFYRVLQDKCPVYKIPERGFFLISRYDDLDAALRDYGTFSSVLERAAVLQGDNGKARKAYEDFFALWKDADPDTALLLEAKKEYAQLK